MKDEGRLGLLVGGLGGRAQGLGSHRYPSHIIHIEITHEIEKNSSNFHSSIID